MLKLSILIFIVFQLTFCQNPAFPKWPNKFQQTFNETFTYGFIKKSTSGVFQYDFDTKTYRIARENGHFDRYCGTNGKYVFLGTKCEHIVSGGDRFLYYPEKNECCYCCSNQHGCGMLKPDWLNGAQFLGQTEYQGQQVYKWNQKGLQDNFYYETIAENPEDRVMVGIDQIPNDTQIYDTQRQNNFENIQLPTVCSKEKTCSVFSVCTALRKTG